MKTSIKFVCSSFTFLVLIGCSGGGGAGSTDTNPVVGIHINHMIVVIIRCKFKNRVTRLEVMPLNQPSRLKLR